MERVACRFSLTLRALSFSPDGTKLAAAGDDNLIKLVEVKEGAVRGRPKATVLARVGGDSERVDPRVGVGATMASLPSPLAILGSRQAR